MGVGVWECGSVWVCGECAKRQVGRRRPAAPQREGVINELNEFSELREREIIRRNEGS